MEIRKKQIENVGIICLTNTPLSILMWAYYAENEGYCIEYDVNAIQDNIENLVQQEFEKKGNNLIYVSATPGDYELEKVNNEVNSFNYLKIIFVHLAQNKAAAKGDSFKVIFI